MINNQDSAREKNIDAIKGVCIIFVIVTHFQWSGVETLQYLFPFWIGLAVPIFMVLSGYNNSKSFKRLGIMCIEESYSLERITKKVVYYSVPFSIVFAIEEILFATLGTANHDFFQIVAAFMRGGYGPGSYYYPMLLQLIFVFPVIYSIIQSKGKVGLWICFGINIIYELLVNVYGMSEQCYRLLILRYFFLIALGTYCARHDFRFSKLVTCICLITGVAYVVFFEYLNYTPIITQYWTGTSCFAGLILVPMLPIIFNKRFCGKGLEMIGKASYEVFLIQMLYYNYAGFLYAYISMRWLQILINVVICVSGGVFLHFLDRRIVSSAANKGVNVLRMIKQLLLGDKELG